MTGTTRKFNWKKTLGTAALVGGIASVGVLAPWAKLTMAKSSAERIEAIYSDGLLARENYDDGELDAIIRRYLPEDAAFGIDRSPTLTHQTYSIRIAGQNLYYLELSIEPDYAARKLVVRGAPTLFKAQISSETSTGLGKLLHGDIHHARHEQSSVLDGTAYRFMDFRASGPRCAVTNSPPTNSRADKLIDIFHAMAEHAKAGGTAATDHQLLPAIRALQVE